MHKPKGNFITRTIDRFLDQKIVERTNADIKKYATDENGEIDEKLARRIKWEVGRRGETGKQLDIYEPLRWTAISTGLGILGAGLAKMISDRATGKTKELFYTIEVSTIVATVIKSGIDLMRLYPRWLSGLAGGRNTAIKLHNEFIAPPNDQAFTPPPEINSASETKFESLKKPAIKSASLMQHAEHDADAARSK